MTGKQPHFAPRVFTGELNHPIDKSQLFLAKDLNREQESELVAWIKKAMWRCRAKTTTQ